MSITELCAILAGEPWCLTPREIGKLTLVQVQELFFRPRDKSGKIRRDPDKLARPKTPREEFVSKWRRWGLSKDRAADLWREKKRKEREAKAAKKAGRKARRGK